MNSMNPYPMPSSSSSTFSSDVTEIHLDQTCSEASRRCTSSVLNALHTLCIPPTICLSVGEDAFSSQMTGAARCQIRKMDEALKVNRGVIDLVSRVLRCPCSEQSSLQLLLVIVCDRLVAWYHAMNSCPSSFAKHLSDHVPTSARSGNDQREQILTQPIKIGEYSADPAMQLHLRDQLVLKELQSVQELLRDFGARVQETKNRDASVQIQKISDILSWLLRNQLQTQTV